MSDAFLWLILLSVLPQIVAREAWEGGAASAPVTLTVVLNDVNDNQPRLPVYPPVSIQAGGARRTIAQVSKNKLNRLILFTMRFLSEFKKFAFIFLYRDFFPSLNFEKVKFYCLFLFKSPHCLTGKKKKTS